MTLSYHDFDFSKDYNEKPTVVINTIFSNLDQLTQGYVGYDLEEYDGPIHSYSMASSAVAAIQNNLITHNIQNDLGSQGGIVSKKYKLSLKGKRLEDYEFVLAFIQFDVMEYPVEIVLEENFAAEVNEGTEYDRYIYNFGSSKTFADFLSKILETNTMKTVLQSIISMAIREENRKEKND